MNDWLFFMCLAGWDALHIRKQMKSFGNCNPLEHQQLCEGCGKVLDPSQSVWLELSWPTNKYHEARSGKIPLDESQGLFPFGSTCASKAVGRTKEEFEAIK